MRKQFKPLTVALALALSAGASAASATTLVYTFHGDVPVLTGGQHYADPLGVFGPAGGVLDGDAVTATFTFDSTLGLRNPAEFPDPGADVLVGGSQYATTFGDGAQTPLVSATVTIDGHTFTYSGAVFGLAQRIGGSSDAFVAVDGDTEALDVALISPKVPNSLDDAFDEQGLGGGSFSIARGKDDEEVDFLLVPEPASWALMLLGVGGAGLALRTERRRAARA